MVEETHKKPAWKSVLGHLQQEGRGCVFFTACGELRVLLQRAPRAGGQAFLHLGLSLSLA